MNRVKKWIKSHGSNIFILILISVSAILVGNAVYRSGKNLWNAQDFDPDLKCPGLRRILRVAHATHLVASIAAGSVSAILILAWKSDWICSCIRCVSTGSAIFNLFALLWVVTLLVGIVVLAQSHRCSVWTMPHGAPGQIRGGLAVSGIVPLVYLLGRYNSSSPPSSLGDLAPTPIPTDDHTVATVLNLDSEK